MAPAVAPEDKLQVASAPGDRVVHLWGHTHRSSAVRNSLADVLGAGRHLPGRRDPRGWAPSVDKIPAESPNTERSGVHPRLHLLEEIVPQTALPQDAALDLRILVAAGPRLKLGSEGPLRRQRIWLRRPSDLSHPGKCCGGAFPTFLRLQAQSRCDKDRCFARH